jgi:arginyl-tRNA synthetase
VDPVAPSLDLDDGQTGIQLRRHLVRLIGSVARVERRTTDPVRGDETVGGDERDEQRGVDPGLPRVAAAHMRPPCGLFQHLDGKARVQSSIGGGLGIRSGPGVHATGRDFVRRGEPLRAHGRRVRRCRVPVSSSIISRGPPVRCGYGRAARPPVVIPDQLLHAVRAALAEAGFPEPDGGVALEPTKQREHGDWTTNVAMQVATAAEAKPRDVATQLAQLIQASPPPHLDRVEVAGPGFLNFHLASTWLHDVLRAVVADGTEYGCSGTMSGQKINLEFVSANPTGPLHAGGGRWVAVGDALANLLAAEGAEVHREYYLNDAGNQLDTFGASLLARYEGRPPPDDGYQGEYLVEMATRLRAELGDRVSADEAREWGYRDVVAQLERDLGRIGVHFDTWFSERTLHERGDVQVVLADLDGRGVSYQKDGATWLRSTDFGDQRDRVLVKSDGAATYLCNDLAYHRDKFARGWQHLIDIWGADHHGQVKSVQSGLEALGYPAGEPEVLLGQLVKLVRGGELVRLSKRAGSVITLADILDEVDPDVCRLTFLLQGIDTALTFDLDVVTSQSMENPVYYVQYAHARIASIGRKAAEQGIAVRPIEEVDLSLLRHERELDLLRALAAYPDVISEAAELRAPHRVTTWVRDFASRFHGFYRDCRVITDDAELTQARLWLATACRVGLANALAILGVNAPEAMSRLDDDDDTDAD